MQSALPLRTRFAIFGAGFLSVVILSGVFSIAAQRQQATSVGNILETAQALRRFQEIDTMRGALRSDVLQMTMVYSGSDIATPAQVKNSTSSHAAALRGNLDQLAEARLEPSVKAAIQKVSGTLTAFVKEAEFLVMQIDRQTTEVMTRLPLFLQSAETLERETADLGQKLDEAGREAAGTVLATSDHAQGGLIAGLLLGGILLTVMTVLLLRAIERPLRRCVAALARIAAGDTDTTLYHPSRDEIGQIVGSIENFRTVTIDLKARVAAEAAEQARKEQEQQALRVALQNFERNISGIVLELQASSREVHAHAETLSGAAAITQTRADHIVPLSRQSSANMQSVAASAEQLQMSIAEITQQVVRSSQMTRDAADRSEDATGTMKTLSERTDRINEIVGLISGIAGQTNLLALNATIEAARAGDAGRGFAIVAGEVKELAKQTANATEEIASQIADIQQAMRRGVQISGEVSELVAMVNSVSTTIAGSVEQQSSATREIAGNAGQVSGSSHQITEGVEEFQREAMHTEESSGRLLAAAQALSGQADILEAEMSAFLKQVRTA
jgi:methyl-accepting chemotaxis protein